MIPHRLISALIFALFLADPAAAQSWSRSWAAAPETLRAPVPVLADTTVRQVVRLSMGGERLRLRLTNEESDRPLHIGAVTVAMAGPDGLIDPGSVRVVTFNGAREMLAPQHAPLLSDPIDIVAAPLARLTVSIYLPQGAVAPTGHNHAAATAWIAPGDQTAQGVLAAATPFSRRVILAGVDVQTAERGTVVVVFGDSITDGAQATVDADTRWPDWLAARLQQAGLKHAGVANLGIGGNRVLKDGTGPNALARFDRDVLSVPGVSQVIVLEGVNDLGSAWRDKDAPPLTSSMLIDAYRQMIVRTHDRGAKIRFATILPFKGAGYWSEAGEAVRTQVNDWIRTNREADGFVDFDKAVRNPNDPARIDAAFDSGDALHPNDAGFRSMAQAIDLRTLH